MNLTQNEIQLYIFIGILSVTFLVTWGFVASWERREERARTERVRKRLNRERADYYTRTGE